ncbi:MAG: AMIN domain-containing protein [Candidatus Krumholzibacteriales bacterium]
MRKTFGISLVLIASFIIPGGLLYAAAPRAEINGLAMEQIQNELKIEISKSGNVEFEIFTMKNPARLVVDCKGAIYDLSRTIFQAQSPLAYRIRTSQFKPEPDPVCRLVIDLKKNVDHRQFEKDGKHVLILAGRSNISEKAQAASESKWEKVVERGEKKLEHENIDVAGASMGSSMPVIKVDRDEGADTGQEEKSPAEKAEESSADTREDEESPWIDGDDAGSSTENPAAPDQAAPGPRSMDVQKTDEKITSENLPWSSSYARGAPSAGAGMPASSRRITIDSQGADIKTVLRTISEFANVNIVTGADVKGDVFVHVKECPWREALEVILMAHGYGYREEYGMIRVAENKTLRKEELEERTVEQKKKDLLPLETRLIFVHNSNAEEIGDALQKVVSKRGNIEVDMGSNALIVNDTEENIEKIGAIVKELDTKHLQVDINAKLVEVDVEAKRELGIKWDMFNLHKSDINAVGAMGVDQQLPVSSGNLSVGTVQSWGELSAVLQALEQDNKANIISNPRITTVDNREATILVGKEIPLIVADEAGNPITELTKIGIMLKVTPHINTDRTITLDLHPEVSELQSESTQQGGVIIATAEADTRVDVANGQTAVIGGLIKKLETDVRTGVPFLKNIPMLGGLFSSSSKVKKKQELVIFVTPTIVE